MVLAAWVLLALRSGGLYNGMAVAAALSVALLLRVGGVRPGWKRGLLALLATAVLIALANWFIIALQVGLPLGLDAWDSLTKLGFNFLWTLLGLAMGLPDAVFISMALLAAALLGR